MIPEELLKPRYKAIADYPNSKFSIGALLIPNRVDGIINDQWVTPDPNDRSFAHVKVETYPHLFKKLEWWEERKESDMPEYVKDEDGLYKVQEWHTNLAPKVTVYINPKIHKGYIDSCTECPLYSSDTLLPATKEEFEEYLNQKK